MSLSGYADPILFHPDVVYQVCDIEWGSQGNWAAQAAGEHTSEVPPAQAAGKCTGTQTSICVSGICMHPPLAQNYPLSTLAVATSLQSQNVWDH